MDDTTHSNRMSILDMISGNVLDAGIVTPTNDTVDIYNGFSLPAFLPQTGAMPCSE
jgi:hypothetical protein